MRHRRVAPLLAVSGLLLGLMGASPVVAGVSTTHWVDDDGLAGPAGCNQLALATTDHPGRGRCQPRLVTRSGYAPGDYSGQVTIDDAPMT